MQYFSRNGEIFRFAEERVAFVKFTPGHRVAEERRIISEMPVLFHANSAINFRFLRARRILLYFFFLLFFPFLQPPVCASRNSWNVPGGFAGHSFPLLRKLEGRSIDTIGKLYI